MYCIFSHVLALGDVVWVISQWFSYPLQHVQIHIFVLFQWYASILETWISTKDLLSMVGCLRQSFQSLPDPVLEGLEPVHRPLRVHSWNWDLCTYYPTHGWTPSGFLSVCVGPHSSHKGTFVHGWTPSCSCFGCCGGETGTKTILFSYAADITLHLIFILVYW